MTKSYSADNYIKNPLGIPSHDYIENTYDNSGNLIRTTYRKGGSSGRITGNLNLVYDSDGNISNALFYKGSYDEDAWAYIKAVETADARTLEDSVRSAINGFVIRCKAVGVWDAIKASCLMVGARTLAGALIPLKGDSPTNYNFVSGDYQRVNGLKGDGTSKRLDTNYKISDKVTGEDLHLGISASADLDGGTLGRPFGVYRENVYTRHYLVVDNTSDVSGWGNDTPATNLSSGHYISSRVTGESPVRYLNGNFDLNLNTDNSTPSDHSVGVFVANGSPTGLSSETKTYYGFSPATLNFYHIGDGLTANQVQKLSYSFSTLLDEIRNIFAFRITVKTDNPGTSNNDQFTLATRSGYTYNYTIDWGDGIVETYDTDSPPTHSYVSVGEYSITVKGIFPTLYYNNGGDVDKIVSIGDIGGTWGNTLERAFWGANNIVSFDKAGDTSGVTNFREAWRGCSSLTSFPLIDTSNGTNFYQAWRGCSSLTSFPLINTSSGTDFYFAWFGCSGLTSFPLINTSSGTNFQQTWQNCTSLTSFPLIDTSSGTNFYFAWFGCSSLTSFPLINTSSGTDFGYAWRNCNSLTSFPLIDTSNGTSFGSAWYGCSSLTSFPLIDTSSGTNFANAWDGCSSLTSFPELNTSNGTNFRFAWLDCSSLTSFPLINTSSGTDFYLAWSGCSSLTSFPLINTSSGASFRQAWDGCSSLTSFPLINTSSGTNFFRTWFNCSSLTSFPLIDTSSGTNFGNAWLNCTSLTSFPANFFDSWTGTPVDNCFVGTWDNCTSLTAQSVENILVSIDTSGQSAPGSGTNIDIDYDVGTGSLSSATTAAITNLKGKGWTPTINGVTQ